MTFLRPTGSQWRTPEYGKNVIVSSWRGITRVQRWPKKVGAPRTPAEAARRYIFTLYQTLIKVLHPRECEYEREAIRQHNRTHRGQRGSAAIRFRDWQTQRLYGRGIAINVSPTLTFYPPAVSRDASLILDWVTDFEGQILQRGALTWQDIPHGQPGNYLTSGGPSQPNHWSE